MVLFELPWVPNKWHRYNSKAYIMTIKYHAFANWNDSCTTAPIISSFAYKNKSHKAKLHLHLWHYNRCLSLILDYTEVFLRLACERTPRWAIDDVDHFHVASAQYRNDSGINYRNDFHSIWWQPAKWCRRWMVERGDTWQSPNINNKQI